MQKQIVQFLPKILLLLLFFLLHQIWNAVSLVPFLQQFLISSKSVTPKGKLMPHWAVPALPGAMKSLLADLLCEIFHARACSLPPDPSKSIFMILMMVGEYRYNC